MAGLDRIHLAADGVFPIARKDRAEEAMSNEREKSSSREDDSLDRFWKEMQEESDEHCVMVAENWNHGVSCSWGRECPLKESF